MGIGSNKTGRTLTAAVVVAGLSFVSATALERHDGIWRLLRAAHFPGPMDEWAHARPVKGAILAGGKRYSFWEYDAINKESHHGRSGLLVFEGAGSSLSYAGMYNVALDDFRGPVHPEIRGKSVFFPYHDYEILGKKQAFSVSFENGPPANIGTIELQR